LSKIKQQAVGQQRRSSQAAGRHRAAEKSSDKTMSARGLCAVWGAVNTKAPPPGEQKNKAGEKSWHGSASSRLDLRIKGA
jgi:hypothetical protein